MYPVHRNPADGDRRRNNPPKSAAQTYQLANAFVKKHGFVLLNQTPFFDADGWRSTKAYAKAHGLTTIPDLKKLSTIKYGAPAENRTATTGWWVSRRSTDSTTCRSCPWPRTQLQGAGLRAGAGRDHLHHRSPLQSDSNGAHRHQEAVRLPETSRPWSGRARRPRVPHSRPRSTMVSALLTLAAISDERRVQLDQAVSVQGGHAFLPPTAWLAAAAGFGSDTGRAPARPVPRPRNAGGDA